MIPHRLPHPGRLFVLLSWAAVSMTSAADAAEFSIEENPEGLLVSENGQKVLFYQKQPQSQNGRYERAHYVHPLYDLEGEVLTEDFPADHRHHRGIFWAWHQLWLGEEQLGDAWTTQDFLARVQSVDTENTADSLTLKAKVHWTSSRATEKKGIPSPIVEEHATITVHPKEESSRKVDFEIRLRALHPGVKIGGSEDAKGYGGFSARIKLSPDTKFFGTDGPVEPQTNAVKAGPWMNFSTESTGVAIFDHPSNPGYPQPWILRRQRSMQNPAWPGREPVKVPEDKPLVLRYRLLIHNGQLDKTEIDEKHQEWAKTPFPKP